LLPDRTSNEPYTPENAFFTAALDKFGFIETPG
jgi:hypothetical protein